MAFSMAFLRHLSHQRLISFSDVFLLGGSIPRALQKVALRRELQSLLRPYLNIERARQLLGFELTSDVATNTLDAVV